jgi:hypothetical protein
MEYKAYLLRLQRRQGSDCWQATLQNAHNGELLHFSNEREMFRYLLKVLAVRPAGSEGAAASEFGLDDAY